MDNFTSNHIQYVVSLDGVPHVTFETYNEAKMRLEVLQERYYPQRLEIYERII